MNCLLFRRLSHEFNVNYINIGFNGFNKQLISPKILRQLNTISNEKHFKQNVLKSNNCLNEWQPMSRSISSSNENHLLSKRLNNIFVEQKRYKKGKKGSKREVREESSDEESDEDEGTEEHDVDYIDGKPVGFQDNNVTLVSLRLDNVIKSGLNMTRAKVDEVIYDNLIRLNSERVTKKSAEVAEDDEIDLIRGLNVDNPNLIDISRVVVKKVEDKMSSKDRVRAKLRKFKTLTIENYEKDPYEGIAINMRQSKEDENK